MNSVESAGRQRLPLNYFLDCIGMSGRNDPCWCGSGIKWKKCHYPLTGGGDEREALRQKYKSQYQIILKTDKQIEGIRRACVLAGEILEAVCAKAAEGVTTNELNTYAHQLHLDAGAIPAPLHYGHPPFPKSICTSLNEVICHGIPDDTPLCKGDILNIDVSPILGGFYGDCSKMVAIGKPSPISENVMDTAYECLMRSIRILRPGILVCDIGEVIESYANSRGCSVVHQFVGHGVGVEFHENPQVLHCRNRNKTPLAEGMIFTIEPMINSGVAEGVVDRVNKWTTRTVDGLPSAQWEHTLLITDVGYEILTTWKR